MRGAAIAPRIPVLAGAFLVVALVATGACHVVFDGQLGSVACEEEGWVGPPACYPDEVCLQGGCVHRAQVEPRLGGPCATHEECAAVDLCLDAAHVGEPGPSFCARTCCSSGDCDPEGDFVCWTPAPGGGGFCRRWDDVGRARPGSARAGEPCELGTECRSGLCEGDVCAEVCCSDTQCTAAEGTCRVATSHVYEGKSFVCTASAPSLSALEPCLADAECRSGLCETVGTAKVCVEPCCGSPGCGSIDQYGKLAPLRCVEVERSGSRLRACAALAPVGGDKPVGAPCAEMAECRSGRCQKAGPGAPGHCTDVCCTDASCGDSSSLRCAPSADAGTWALRCEPK